MYVLDIYIIYVYLIFSCFYNLVVILNLLYVDKKIMVLYIILLKMGNKWKFLVIKFILLLMYFFNYWWVIIFFFLNKCWIKYIYVIYNKIVIYIINVFELVKM